MVPLSLSPEFFRGYSLSPGLPEITGFLFFKNRLQNMLFRTGVPKLLYGRSWNKKERRDRFGNEKTSSQGTAGVENRDPETVRVILLSSYAPTTGPVASTQKGKMPEKDGTRMYRGFLIPSPLWSPRKSPAILEWCE